MEAARTHGNLRRLGGSVLTSSLALLFLPHGFGGTATAAGPSRSASRYSVVAQSDIETAATGRRPISTRIALARQPISVVPAVPEQPPLETIAEQAAAEAAAVNQPVAAAERSSDQPLGYQTLEALAAEPARPVPHVAALTSEPAAVPPVAETDQTPLLSVGGLAYPASAASKLPVPGKPGLLPPATSAVTLRVSESHPETTEGEAIEWRLQLCNAGSEPAHNVSAMLFFAEGIEPVAASGGEASLATGEVRFDTLASLGPGEIVELLVTGIGTEAGAVQYRAEVISSAQPEPIAQDGVVQVTAGR